MSCIWSCYHGVRTVPCDICFSSRPRGFWYRGIDENLPVESGSPDKLTRFAAWFLGWHWAQLS